MTAAEIKDESTLIGSENQFQKGVKRLYDKGISKLPTQYIWPALDRPDMSKTQSDNLQLPVIDFAELQGPNRIRVLESLQKACETYGFFQVVNHGIPVDVTSTMMEASKRMFELPFEEREKYMTPDMAALVRYGTSFIQTMDGVLSWRDFFKLTCNPPVSQAVQNWPSSPINFRELAVPYVNQTRNLFFKLVEAIWESLGLSNTNLGDDTSKTDEEGREIYEDLKDGSQIIMMNCFPPCPEPHLTLGMPPHSDYGFLTLLLQDQVKGLQLQLGGKWVTVEPIPNSFLVNVGDHLEIFSNGRYKSVLHRVMANSTKSRISIASLHSVPSRTVVKPAGKLIDDRNPKRYMDTDFATFIKYITSNEFNKKNFLESRKLVN
ncbi:probable 2-oxoglutarate-dependent dioxygenase SLC1 [Impatiens glandulifera]|uniref:probable 2-oxoglutarate-dependent dioxygenase SLC1 n=1 Tax=Impatiens glandulifera TaxID=253017 RepID=UPI001FB171B8|nr:probable 2-oxoglutarate-dependent dioxygenase SLC1 [Impatiens glandulifera]